MLLSISKERFRKASRGVCRTGIESCADTSLLEECHPCHPIADTTIWCSTITGYSVSAARFAVMLSIVRHCNDREKFSNWMSDIFYLIQCKFWMLSRLLSICSAGIFYKANNLALHMEWGEKINWKKIYLHWWWSTHASCLNKKIGFCFCFFP